MPIAAARWPPTAPGAAGLGAGCQGGEVRCMRRGTLALGAHARARAPAAWPACSACGSRATAAWPPCPASRTAAAPPAAPADPRCAAPRPARPPWRPAGQTHKGQRLVLQMHACACRRSGRGGAGGASGRGRGVCRRHIGSASALCLWSGQAQQHVPGLVRIGALPWLCPPLPPSDTPPLPRDVCQNHATARAHISSYLPLAQQLCRHERVKAVGCDRHRLPRHWRHALLGQRRARRRPARHPPQQRRPCQASHQHRRQHGTAGQRAEEQLPLRRSRRGGVGSA